MSYFVTITGDKLDIGDIATAELVEAPKAQSYIATASSTFSALDGPGTVFLVHDRETGTSDDLVGAAIDAVFGGIDFANTDLAKVLSRAARASCTVRIWDAGAVNPVADRPVETGSLNQLLETLSKMAKKGHIKYVRSQLTTSWSGP